MSPQANRDIGGTGRDPVTLDLSGAPIVTVDPPAMSGFPSWIRNLFGGGSVGARPQPQFTPPDWAMGGYPDLHDMPPVTVGPPSYTYPVPGGGDMSQATGDWRENATKVFNPISGMASNWRSEPRGFFGAQTVSGLPMWEGFGSAGGGGPWRTLLA
jgi:hypothetical protein